MGEISLVVVVVEFETRVDVEKHPQIYSFQCNGHETLIPGMANAFQPDPET